LVRHHVHLFLDCEIKDKSLSILLLCDDMSKRYSPLLNIGFGLLAVGEAVSRMIVGDVDGATDSGLAALCLTWGVTPYFMKGVKDGDMNLLSGYINGATGLISYSFFYIEKSSKSISYNAVPWISGFQFVTNSLEYGIKNFLERRSKLKYDKL